MRVAPAVSRQPAKLGKESGHREGSLAGGFGYRESASPSSICRNRFVLWYVEMRACCMISMQ